MNEGAQVEAQDQHIECLGSDLAADLKTQFMLMSPTASMGGAYTGKGAGPAHQMPGQPLNPET